MFVTGESPRGLRVGPDQVASRQQGRPVRRPALSEGVETHALRVGHQPALVADRMNRAQVVFYQVLEALLTARGIIVGNRNAAQVALEQRVMAVRILASKLTSRVT